VKLKHKNVKVCLFTANRASMKRVHQTGGGPNVMNLEGESDDFVNLAHPLPLVGDSGQECDKALI